MIPDMKISVKQPRVAVPWLPGTDPYRGGFDKYTRTLPWDSDTHTMVEALHGLMVAMGYTNDSVLEAMLEFAEERLPRSSTG
jgi:hypothetical protein